MKLNCLIVEDEPLAANIIEKYIAKIEGLILVEKCTNAISAFNILNKQKIDVIFLDIKMPQISGIEFLKSLKNPPKIILTTAYRDYALDGFELDVVDYLLKPISFERFLKAVNKLLTSSVSQLPVIESLHKNSDTAEGIFVKSDKKMVKINFNDIIYIEGLKDYIQIVTSKEKIITYLSLSAIEEKLPRDLFLRVHRSFIVSFKKIKSYTAVSVEVPGKLLTIGRYYKKSVLAKLEKSEIVQ